MPERQDLEDRLSRARSWILSARDFGRKGDHRHIEFLMLYVAFNSLYGRRQFEGSKAQARADLNQFLKKVRAMRRLDETAGGITLSKAILSGQVESLRLLESPFYRGDYWASRADLKTIQRWCAADVRRGQAVLAENRYEDFLDPVLWRLTVLRNQIAHGCVTYGSRSKGFPGVLDGLGVLRSVVPAFERLTTTWGLKLNDDPELQWEPLPYPRLESVRHPALGRLS